MHRMLVPFALVPSLALLAGCSREADVDSPTSGAEDVTGIMLAGLGAGVENIDGVAAARVRGGDEKEYRVAFRAASLRQRVAVDMSGRSTKTQMIGEDVAMPVALAPVGMTGMQRADGEIKAARAAEKFGVPFTLSTMSINSIEDVADDSMVPATSLLREFIGGSAYDLH